MHIQSTVLPEELSREYPCLAPEQADGFVEETVKKVGNTIQDALAVWNERNRG